MTNLLIFGIFGLIFGSFANVLILRDQDRKSILTGRSACPKCHQVLRWFELIPVFSFLIQGGRCRSCKQPISWQYPLVELSTAGLFMLAAWLGGGLIVQILMAAAFFAFLVPAVIDLKTQWVPLEYLALGAVLSFLAQLLSGTTWQYLLLGAIVGGGSLLLVRLIWQLLRKEEGMGSGDPYIAASLGLLTGFHLILVTLVLAIFSGSIIGLLALSLRKTSLSSRIPFGPFLFLAAIASLIWGNWLIDWYTVLSGISYL